MGLPLKMILTLYLGKNAVTHLLYEATSQWDHITLYFHYLMISFHIRFKMLKFTFKAPHAQRPTYFRDCFSLHVPMYQLQSAQQSLLSALPPMSEIHSAVVQAHTFSVGSSYFWSNNVEDIGGGGGSYPPELFQKSLGAA